MYAVEILEIKEKLQNLFFKRNRVSFHCFQKYINEFYLNISGFSTKDVTYISSLNLLEGNLLSFLTKFPAIIEKLSTLFHEESDTCGVFYNFIISILNLTIVWKGIVSFGSEGKIEWTWTMLLLLKIYQNSFTRRSTKNNQMK